jgi:meso-butanediol dehydrogenase / (S,S)-butanediol dehydrogenase / diacetyl reductase
MKTILLSGGSSGLGRATAALLVKDYNVIILGRTEESLKKTADDLGCSYIVCDITDENSVGEAVAKVVAEHNQIEYLINNAGAYISGAADENSMDVVKGLFATNVYGLMNLTRAVMPHMKEAKTGVIINVLSTAALHGDADGSMYHASKFAADGFTQSIADELKQFGIRVSAVYPGGFADNEDATNLNVSEIARGVEFIVKAGPRTIVPKLVIQHSNF